MTRVAQMDARVTKLKPATRTTKSGGRSMATIGGKMTYAKNQGFKVAQ